MKRGNNAIDIFLQPGEYFAGDASFRIRTLLGSCVSVALWHEQKKVGAMSHFLLPTRAKKLSGDLDGRYGDEALLLMLAELKQFGIKGNQCVAKVFGGGNMFSKRGENIPQIGRRNGESARHLLEMHNIPIVSESLFGNGHRQIIFDVSNGDVWARQVKQIGRAHV